MEKQPQPAAPLPPLNLVTLGRFLTGGQRAILTVAGARRSLLLGLLFVLSAGLAREYDGEDLIAEPWHLLLPLVVSLAASLLLFGVLFLVHTRHTEAHHPFTKAYPRFLAAFWMTAPMAWLYAIPVERLLDTADAVRANIGLLAIVSLWRVLLITRCAAVLFGSSLRSMFFPVMLYSDTVALAIVAYTPIPIFNIMGGVRLTESEQVIQGAALMTQFFGGVTWPVWLIGTLVLLGRSRFGWRPPGLDRQSPPTITRPLWFFSILLIAFGAALLPFTQPPQRLRQSVDNHLAAGRVEQAITKMSAHQRNDFPRHWDPAPWPTYNKNTPPLHLVLQAINNRPAAPWVRELYLDKFLQQIDGWYGHHFWTSAGEEELPVYVAVVESAPEAQKLVRSYTGRLQEYRKDDRCSEPRRELLGRLLKIVTKPTDE